MTSIWVSILFLPFKFAEKNVIGASSVSDLVISFALLLSSMDYISGQTFRTVKNGYIAFKLVLIEQLLHG